MLKHRLLPPIVTLALVACSESVDPVSDLGIAPNANADAGSSYENARSNIWIQYNTLPRPFSSAPRLGDAIAYLDADGDGDTDVFLATGEFMLQGEVDNEMFLNDGANGFTYDVAGFAGDIPQATHARKSLVADFNGDRLDDVLVLDHGFDANPFPGSMPKLIIQDAPGTFSWSRLTAQTGFHHGGAAGDVDNDGDIDVFVGGFEPFFFINDGTAGFTKVDDRFDGSIGKVFSAELIDVDEDGFLDLLLGAHERDGDETSVYWGSSTGAYTQSDRTIVPAAAPFGAVLDFEAEDIDGDGDRDLIVNRTRDGDDGPGANFYNGRRTQLVRHDGNRGFTDATAQIDDPGTDADQWFPWLRIRDVDGDGDLDIAPDDSGFGFAYLNDGTGRFTKSSITP